MTLEQRARDVVLDRLKSRKLPPHFKFVGDRVEDLFDPANRHKPGKKATDYLASWLSMLRPFAYASHDDSWGELEKLLCIVMINYVEAYRLLPEAAETIEALLARIAELEADRAEWVEIDRLNLGKV